MKKLILFLLLSVSLLSASSQKLYFIYIQTEAEQPFFVKMNEKLYSSYSSGYLIIPKLIDSTYSFSIGFPQNKWPEQKFSVTINKKDNGYLLKNFGEKGWGLFNLQTLSVQMASDASAKIESSGTIENNEVSPFTEILAKAADDPALKQKTAAPAPVNNKPEIVVTVKKEEPAIVAKEIKTEKTANDNEKVVVAKEEKTSTSGETVVAKPVVEVEKPVNENIQSVVEAKPVEKQEPAKVIEEVVIEKPAQKPEQKEDKIEVVAVVSKDDVSNALVVSSDVRKWSESSTTEGFGLVFIDNYENGEKDTIRLIIPNPKPVEVAVSAAQSDVKEAKRFIDIDDPTKENKEGANLADVKPVVAETQTVKPMLSNNCTIVAEEADFLKLRKQMAARETEEDMILEAKKYFKTRCFTSAQIKNLSTLFLNDDSRYQFLDTAYRYVSDAENYSMLQNQLKDDYYINRFRAMLRN